jgi:hypothetical protein
VATLQTISLIIMLGFILFVIGKQYGNYAIGVLGGLMLFITGSFILMDPITNVSSNFNLLIGAILFVIGAYIWVTGTIEQIDNSTGG